MASSTFPPDLSHLSVPSLLNFLFGSTHPLPVEIKETNKVTVPVLLHQMDIPEPIIQSLDLDQRIQLLALLTKYPLEILKTSSERDGEIYLKHHLANILKDHIEKHLYTGKNPLTGDRDIEGHYRTPLSLSSFQSIDPTPPSFSNRAVRPGFAPRLPYSQSYFAPSSYRASSPVHDSGLKSSIQSRSVSPNRSSARHVSAVRPGSPTRTVTLPHYPTRTSSPIRDSGLNSSIQSRPVSPNRHISAVRPDPPTRTVTLPHYPTHTNSSIRSRPVSPNRSSSRSISPVRTGSPVRTVIMPHYPSEAIPSVMVELDNDIRALDEAIRLLIQSGHGDSASALQRLRVKLILRKDRLEISS